MKKISFCIALLLAFSANAQKMPSDTLDLEELVFVGFSKEKKVNLTGSVSQVNMSEVLGDRPVSSIGAALQGAIPGLSISGASAPGQALPDKSGSGWIYIYPSPLASGKRWLDKYYLDQVPLDQIKLNPELSQNAGYE